MADCTAQKALMERFATLSDTDRELYRAIYAPTPVLSQAEDAVRGLCVMPDGRIRHYGTIWKHSVDIPGRIVYHESCDLGLSWKLHLLPQSPFQDTAEEIPVLQTLGSAFRSPYSGRYLKLFSQNDRLYCAIGTSPEDHAPRVFKVADSDFGNGRMPIALQNRKRLIVAAERRDLFPGLWDYPMLHPVIWYSDDDGESWKEVTLPPVPPMKVEFPHKGPRWQNGACEPTIAERSDGSLLMLCRTSRDFHYFSESFDGGESWTPLRPSPFYATLTMPTLYRLQDGRILCFWCNTRPLAETEKKGQIPPLDKAEQEGQWEDVFTNRDATHVAISEDDGKTWIGFRELYLNPLRNDADFRTHGDPFSSRDKSVHQAQVEELPEGKILIAIGQSDAVRTVLLFDIQWIYETTRTEDFRCGMGNLSTFGFRHSISGNFRGFSGHCHWNRYNTVAMMPEPDYAHYPQDVLFFSTLHDPRSRNDLQGAVWNFPASRRGEISLCCYRCGMPLRISLSDAWLNPTDEYVAQLAPMSYLPDKQDLPYGKWFTLTLRYDCDRQMVTVWAEEHEIAVLPLPALANGLCYLHLQTASQAEDAEGFYIKRLQKINL